MRRLRFEFLGPETGKPNPGGVFDLTQIGLFSLIATIIILRLHCMEQSAHAHPGPSDSVTTYPTAPEDSQQADPHIDIRKALDLFHGTSSSPDLNAKIKPSLPDLGRANVSISRTRTLPLRSPKRGPSVFPTLQGITFEVENLERLRRWVLGLAIGNFDMLV